MNDTWTFANGQWRNITSIAGTPPTARFGMAMTYDAADQYVLAFGGSVSNCPAAPGSDACNDTWSFVGGRWSQIETNHVIASGLPLMTYDPTDSHVLLLEESGATYEYRSGTWTPLVGANNTTFLTPNVAYGAGLTYDAHDGYVVLFGGVSGEQAGYTWIFASGKWTNVTSTSGPSPSGREYFAMTYDDATAEVLLYGGASLVPPYSTLNDMWTFTEGKWQELSSAGASPPGLAGAALANDSRDSTVVLFGGNPAGPLNVIPENYTWVWGSNPPIAGLTVASSPSVPLPNQTVSFHSSFLGGEGPFNYSWQLGDGSESFLANPSHSYVTVGQYLVRLWVNDSGGHSGNASLELRVYVPLTVATLDASPNPVTLGQTVIFNATAMGGTPPYTYAWLFGDGGTGGNLSSISHIYTTDGPFTVRLTVGDSMGDATQSFLNVSIELQALSGSTASSGATPLTVEFVGQGQGGFPPYTYQWTFGDGTPAADVQNPTHTYNVAGTFLTSLLVIDEKGDRSTSSLSIRVGLTPVGTTASGPTWWIGLLLGIGVAGAIATVWGIDRVRRQTLSKEGSEWVDELTGKSVGRDETNER